MADRAAKAKARTMLGLYSKNCTDDSVAGGQGRRRGLVGNGRK